MLDCILPLKSALSGDDPYAKIYLPLPLQRQFMGGRCFLVGVFLARFKKTNYTISGDFSIEVWFLRYCGKFFLG
ncbi:MAG: hypothetical protein ACI9C4_003008 [Paraglaciecola sp.]|jgi:hypothetical protein